jgi:DNA topoisomerase II
MILPAQAAEQNKIVSKTINKRWEIAVTLSPDSSFKQISFVNGIATTKGGTHVKAIETQILKHLVSVMSKKAKKLGLKVTKNSIRNHLFICVNCLVENPSFDSQTKEQLTTPPANFGSSCELPKSTLKMVAGPAIGIVDLITRLATFKAKSSAAPSANKTRRLRGIQKLDDANNAGTVRSTKCKCFFLSIYIYMYIFLTSFTHTLPPQTQVLWFSRREIPRKHLRCVVLVW